MGRSKNKKDKLFCALDESNHGRDEEIFVLSFSNVPDYARLFKTDLGSKQRRDEIERRTPVLNRLLDYRFCVVNKEHYSGLGPRNIIPCVLFSFFKSLGEDNFRELAIYVDGELSLPQKEKIKREIESIRNRAHSKLEVYSIAKTKDPSERISTNILLSFADFQAGFLFHQSRYDTSDKRGKYYKKRVDFLY